MKIDLDNEEIKILQKAVAEYEDRMYMSEGRKWQNVINELMYKIDKIDKLTQCKVVNHIISIEKGVKNYGKNERTD